MHVSLLSRQMALYDFISNDGRYTKNQNIFLF